MTTEVMLTCEGTYPFHGGGVSAWCHEMIRYAAGTDFHIFSIAGGPDTPLLFKLPENVRSLETLALWGGEEPGPSPLSFAQAYQRKLLTTDEAIAAGFLPSFAVIVRSIFDGLDADADALGHAFHTLHLYFENYDYATTVTSRAAWECFKTSCPRSASLTLDEATVCMRWLVRYLAVTARPYRRTGVVHASMAGLAAVPGVLSKLRYGTPFLLSEHGIYLRELYVSLSTMDCGDACRRFLLGWNQAIVRMNYHFADHVTCLGEFNRKWQLRFGANPEKIDFVPNGVDPARFFADPVARPSSPTVLTLARIYPLKGITNLLRAAAIVVASLPKARFRILGDVADPAYYAECLRLVNELGLASAVEFGVTREPEKAMRAAHVYCLPSVSEGLPYTLLEAMFSGLPVVATDVGNVAETMNGTGLLAAPGNPAELARALLSLLDGDGAAALRDRLAAAALARARKHYTLDASMRPFTALYEAMHHCRPTRQSL